MYSGRSQPRLVVQLCSIGEELVERIDAAHPIPVMAEAAAAEFA
jgi:hypothetical protein